MMYLFNSWMVLVAVMYRLSVLVQSFIRPRPVKTVVIIQLAKLGDMVCTTPLFRAIKQHRPDMKVIVVGNSINKELLAGHSNIDEYIPWTNVWEVAKLLRTHCIDWGCCTGPTTMGILALYLAGIPYIVIPKVINGKSPYETWSYKFLRCLAKKANHAMDQYAPREYLRLLEPLGIITSDTSKSLVYTSEAYGEVSSILKMAGITEDDLLVCISPVAGHKIKEWGSENFTLLITELLKRTNSKIVVIGTSKDRESVDLIVGSFPNESRLIDLRGSLSVEKLKALIAMSHLFISVDTGPLYIAEAFDVPTIDIVGPVDERVQPPRGEKHIVLMPPRQKAQLFIMNSRDFDREEALRQAQAVTPEEVVAAAVSLIETIPRHSSLVIEKK